MDIPVGRIRRTWLRRLVIAAAFPLVLLGNLALALLDEAVTVGVTTYLNAADHWRSSKSGHRVGRRPKASA